MKTEGKDMVLIFIIFFFNEKSKKWEHIAVAQSLTNPSNPLSRHRPSISVQLPNVDRKDKKYSQFILKITLSFSIQTKLFPLDLIIWQTLYP